MIQDAIDLFGLRGTRFAIGTRRIVVVCEQRVDAALRPMWASPPIHAALRLVWTGTAPALGVALIVFSDCADELLVGRNGAEVDVLFVYSLARVLVSLALAGVISGHQAAVVLLVHRLEELVVREAVGFHLLHVSIERRASSIWTEAPLAEVAAHREVCT